MLFKIFVSCLAVELHSATLLKCEKLTTAKISLLLPNIHIYIYLITINLWIVFCLTLFNLSSLDDSSSVSSGCLSDTFNEISSTNDALTDSSLSSDPYGVLKRHGLHAHSSAHLQAVAGAAQQHTAAHSGSARNHGSSTSTNDVNSSPSHVSQHLQQSQVQSQNPQAQQALAKR